MKYNYLQLFFTAFIIFCSPGVYSQWQYLGPQAFSSGSIGYSSTAADKDGNIYMAYQDQSDSLKKITVKKYTSGAWENVGPEKFSLGEADFISLAIDSASGTPYVAYQDAQLSVTVRKFNGTNWDTIGHSGFTGAMATYESLIVLNGTPYVAYEDFSANDFASVSKFNGTTWVQLGGAGISSGDALYFSLLADHQGNLYIGYRDIATSNAGITVQKFEGSQWFIMGASGFSTGGAKWISLAVDNSDNLYAAFQDGGASIGKSASVVKWDAANAQWANVGSEGFTPGEADYVSLAINKQGIPYVAYSDVANGSKASVMEFNGSIWTPTGASDFSSGTALYTGLALDSTGGLYVGYVDGANGNFASVQTNAHPTAISAIADEVHFKAFPNPSRGNFEVEMQTSGNWFNLAVFDLLGQLVWKTESRTITSGYSTPLDLSGLSKGSYLLRLQTDRGVETQKIEIE